MPPKEGKKKVACVNKRYADPKDITLENADDDESPVPIREEKDPDIKTFCEFKKETKEKKETTEEKEYMPVRIVVSSLPLVGWIIA
uniref:Uncharacterized protein n=1 Tax=Tetranychus urticae TaxID=32264 RepID=T1JZ53_TETUR